MPKLVMTAALVFGLALSGTAQPRPPVPGSAGENDVRQASATMASYWRRHDARNYVTALSADTDWENAAGWRLRGKGAVERYLREYLWASDAPTDFTPLGERVVMASPDLAVVDTEARASSSVAPGGPSRRVRQVQFFRKQRGRWEVTATRIWEPVAAPAPPRLPDLSAEPFGR